MAESGDENGACGLKRVRSIDVFYNYLQQTSCLGVTHKSFSMLKALHVKFLRTLHTRLS